MTWAVRSLLKINIYRLFKLVGLFYAARLLTRGGLRILCYHGFAMSDENQFCPGLFMGITSFEKRMWYLKKHGYAVLSLERACQLLSEDKLPSCSVVLTIDDGFYSTLKLAQPILLRYSFPATIYVTSYYSIKETPIFRLVIQYLFWKSREEYFDLSGIGLPASLKLVSMKQKEEKERIMWEVIRFGESELDEPGRCELAARLAERATVDLASLARHRMMSLMNSQEILAMANSGLEVQLHTHRHCLPNDRELAQREIVQNREYLELLLRKKLDHFCYPCGIWSVEQWPWLTELGVATATTCDVGLNYKHTPQLALKRILDGDNLHLIEFEAEVCGLTELIRRGRSFIMGTLAMCQRTKHDRLKSPDVIV